MKNPPSPSPLANILIPLFLFLLSPSASQAARSSLSRGSSLSVREDDSDILLSPSKSFACGFYNIGSNAYALSIWFSNSNNKTVAWTANRDHPVNGRGSEINFRKDGGVFLTDTDGTVVWSTNTSSTQADRLQLLDSGNLVVMDPKGNILWQSFDYPTDTLLPTQPITKTIQVVSAAAEGSLSPSYYRCISTMIMSSNSYTMDPRFPAYTGPTLITIRLATEGRHTIAAGMQ